MLSVGGGVCLLGGDERSQKRVAAVAKPTAQLRMAATRQMQPRSGPRTIAAQLKDIEKNQARKKESPTMRRRLEQAGLSNVTARTYWIVLRRAGGCWRGFSVLSAIRPRW